VDYSVVCLIPPPRSFIPVPVPMRDVLVCACVYTCVQFDQAWPVVDKILEQQCEQPDTGTQTVQWLVNGKRRASSTLESSLLRESDESERTAKLLQLAGELSPLRKHIADFASVTRIVVPPSGKVVNLVVAGDTQKKQKQT
jgi:hypothetical protein